MLRSRRRELIHHAGAHNSSAIHLLLARAFISELPSNPSVTITFTVLELHGQGYGLCGEPRRRDDPVS